MVMLEIKKKGKERKGTEDFKGDEASEKKYLEKCAGKEKELQYLNENKRARETKNALRKKIIR